ncbi:hypothetical protein QWJ34_06440 [Saccharibacillus sp. CPCC 101409]|uniref:hypothetical protein n=1 Tax=Saccharibacillus sp. CPCC 101409 TaxID=3058041 RepID=UPI002671B521|nr:hypothetical protein [Saccharibacillus sp. CPCC 101409]MDO3409395.1 hypothetical protein [Saccharibacillus sp. CPCC 101409]
MNKLGVQFRASFIQIRPALWVVIGLIAVSMIADFTVNMALGDSAENVQISSGNMLLALLPIVAILLPLRTFRQMLNFGASRSEFFKGQIAIYAFAALLLALFNSLWWLLETGFIRDYRQTINILEVFHWTQFGPVGMFVYQTVFYFFVLTLFNLLFSGLQSAAGWVLWVLLIAAIPVGTAIASLRVHVADFFLALLFNDSLIAGMAVNLGLSLAFLAGAWLFTARRRF